jgi:anthranilate phosphoribosyltransferase
MPTIMNLLGPLTNPARARRQVVGVSHPRMLELVAGGLRELGHEHALVVHGDPGMDELSPIGVTQAIEVRNGEVRRITVDPRDHFDVERLDAAELRGGDPDYNARVVDDILNGRLGGAARAAVVLNAGAAILIAGKAESIHEGVAAAEKALDQGKGIKALEDLRAATRAVVCAAQLSAE